MPHYSTSDIRNIALVGHAGAGKTSLIEAVLFKAGAIHQVGQVEKGNTVADFTDEEKAHGQSLFSSILHCEYDKAHINLIDTPGSPDFIGQAISVMPAVETMAVVINAAVGIEPMARRLMELAGERKLCRMVIINKIDAENTDLPALLANLQEMFGSQCLPINLPAKGRQGVIDVFSQTDGEADFGDVAQAHTAIIDQIVEVDEKLMELYLEQGDVKPDQLHEPFEKAMREGHLVPVCFTAARLAGDHEQSVGVKELLEFFAHMAPTPLEGNPRPFVRGDDTENLIHPDHDPAKPALAHVFQIDYDPFVGKLSVFRVHQGTINGQSQLFIGDPKHGESKKPLRIGHVFKLQGKQHVEVDALIPGDIGALAKVDEVHHDAVLHESHGEDRLHLLPLPFPEPMSGFAITPKRRGDEQKLADALTKLVDEDPTFTVTRDRTTHETVIRGIGDLHLRVMLEKLKNRFHVEVDTKPPKIAYRETVTVKAEGHHRHKKQTGGAGQFGEVYLRVEPLPRGSGFEFEDDTFGGSIPNQFLPAVEKGVRQVLETGAIAGYPLQDVKVQVYDGKHHAVDSKEIAFITAGRKAFLDGIQKAKPVLLEPMVRIEVTVPNQFMGDITGDLSGKRGRISGTDMLAGDQVVVKAVVPLAEVANYQNQLKSVTGGQGSYTIELHDYEPVPAHVQQQIVAQFKPQAEED